MSDIFMFQRSTEVYLMRGGGKKDKMKADSLVDDCGTKTV